METNFSSFNNFVPLTKSELANYNMQSLAFVGDAVFSLFVRANLALFSTGKSGSLHKASVSIVKAAAQSEILDFLLGSNIKGKSCMQYNISENIIMSNATDKNNMSEKQNNNSNKAVEATNKGIVTIKQKNVKDACLLTEEEISLVTRARNTKVNAPTKKATRAEYMKSTAFEALLGYLYLGGENKRLDEVLALSMECIKSSE